MRLDEEKLEALRSWGERLRQGSGAEHAAVGRAILMLVEEIDRLHIELWHSRMRPAEEAPIPSAESARHEGGPVSADLHDRLKGVLGRGSESSAVEHIGQAGRGSASESAETAQSWIAALRRQK